MTPAPASARAGNWSRAKYGAIMPDAYYDQIARCETGRTLAERYEVHSYTSPLGINRSTAARWSGRRSLAGLTPRQLVRIADRIAFSGWTNRAGQYVHPVGPFGWGTVRHGCGYTLGYLCHSMHKRVQKHRARACRLAAANG